MWCEYMRDALGFTEGPGGGTKLGLVTSASLGPKLVSADFHGAELEVVRSRCVSRVGVRGIVVKDTKFTFEIVTRANEIKTIPKEHTVFRFAIPTKLDSENERLVFELQGSQFENRAPERAKKKFKQHIAEDL